MLFSLAIGGGFYWFSIQDVDGLKGANAATAITTTSDQTFAGLVIASKGEPEVPAEPKTQLVTASVATPETKIIAKDSDATLRRLTELTEKNGEAAGLIKSLKADLNRVEEEADDLTRQVNDLSAENKRIIALGDSQKTNIWPSSIYSAFSMMQNFLRCADN